ncbi:hypothetical protein LXL04_005944 [Taraxacum kok-saghyz]
MHLKSETDTDNRFPFLPPFLPPLPVIDFFFLGRSVNACFTSEDHYEWLKDYSHFRHLIHQHVKPSSLVLELGCGNSQLSDELYKEGITKLTCIDLSSVAVDKKKKQLLSKGFTGLFIHRFNLNLLFVIWMKPDGIFISLLLLLDMDVGVKKVDTPSLDLFQDELDNEDYLFRTNIDELDDER